MSIQIQIRRDDTANWESKNPTLAEGEIGYDLTEDKFKVGDGTSAWMELGYSGAGGTDLVTSVNSQTGDVVLTVDDLSDVSASNPTRDDLLIFNGTSWSADNFDFIQTALNFKGATNVAQAAPAAEQGDLYVNDTEGTAEASWTGIAGKVVKVGNFIGHANSRWYLLGEMAEIGVTNVMQGLGISVDASKPAEPVVSIDRTETDKWYLTSYTETDPTVPAHVKSISTTNISNWNAAHGWGNHATAGYQPAGSYAPTSHTHSYVPLSGNSTINGSLTCTGNITAYSDERLKSHVETLDGSKVYEMRGVSFIKDGEAGSGVIAQEIQKVAPELVEDSGEYLSVAYGNLVGYLIEAVKELKAEIEELKRG